MEEFARKLMDAQEFDPNVRLVVTTGLFTAALRLGAVGVRIPTLDLGIRIRIGLWPFISKSDPEVAMGLMTVLSYLLGRWQGTRIYRLFASVEGDPEQFGWSIDKSQFGVDDWSLDDLDENVAIWGEAEHEGDAWALHVEVENDLSDEEEPTPFDYQARQLSDLVASMPKLASEIAAALGLQDLKPLLENYALDETDQGKIESLLKQLFHWELMLYLFLWGKPWDEEAFDSDHEQLLSAAQEIGGDFGAWCVSIASARAMLPAYQPLGEWLISRVNRTVGRFPDTPIPAIFLASGLFGSEADSSLGARALALLGQDRGYFDEAIQLLESSLELHSESAPTWIMLAELFRRRERVLDAVDAYQRAILGSAGSDDLYMRYAELILSLADEGRPLDEFVLIDPEEHESGDLTTWEAVEAYQRVLDNSPDQLDALYNQLTRLVDLGQNTPRLWSGFERLVALDKTGDRVHSLIDQFLSLEDIVSLLDILEKAAKKEPERWDLRVNLAAAYLVDERNEDAKAELEAARKLTDNGAVLAEISRYMLAADDPDFEARMGEITDKISAGKALEVEEVDFLEAAIEKAPSFGEGYILLAKAYLEWNEPSDALDTLLDGQKALPDDPDITELLARVLWDSEQEALAIEYLNHGLVKDPNNVLLLALTGQYLFEDEQTEAAKALLERAELIAPQHPALNAARMHIAKLLSDIEEGEDEL